VKGNPDKNLRLRIVGDGPERENLEFRVRNEELNGSVDILGFQGDVWPFLEESDVFVLPSLREGSSVSQAEAMTAGLPSIVTQVGGASEILGDSQSGILIDPFDISSIQGAMQQMIDLSPEEREAMGERAKKESQRFSVENYIQKLMEIYSGI
jgi:glycosyltransferase involved in cell wall biosynthesis